MQTLFDSLLQNKSSPTSIEIFKLQSPKDLIAATTSHGESLLTIAAQVNATKIVEYLLEIGLYKNQMDSRGGTALMRAAAAKSLETIDILLNNYVDPRLVSSFSGKKAHEIINYKPLTEYAKKFENLLSNPFFNYKYRQVYEFRYSLSNLSAPNLIRNMKLHPLLEGITNWTDKLDLIKYMELEYEKYLKGDVDPLKGCLYCEEECKTRCSICKKVFICDSCKSSKDPLLKIGKDIHINNCKQGIFQ